MEVVQTWRGKRRSKSSSMENDKQSASSTCKRAKTASHTSVLTDLTNHHHPNLLHSSSSYLSSKTKSDKTLGEATGDKREKLRDDDRSEAMPSSVEARSYPSEQHVPVVRKKKRTRASTRVTSVHPIPSTTSPVYSLKKQRGVFNHAQLSKKDQEENKENLNTTVNEYRRARGQHHTELVNEDESSDEVEEDDAEQGEGPWWGEGVRVKAGPNCPRGLNTSLSLLSPASSRLVEDIDLKHPHDPVYCRTYVKDIYSYLRSLQHKYVVPPNYMKLMQGKRTGRSGVHASQRVTPGMRSILVDWLVEVAEEYMLLSDTLYLCVSYLDRFLAKKKVCRTQLQLVGCVCLLIAAKYEEQYAPQVDEFVMITDRSYTRNELLQMEAKVLKELDFRLTVATVKAFLRRFQRAAYVNSTEKHLCNYLAELSLICYEFVSVPADQVAASAVLLARLTLYASDSENTKLLLVSASFSDDDDVWTAELKHYTGFTKENLAQVVRKLHALHDEGSKPSYAHRAIFEKYNLPVFESVASTVKPYQGKLLPQMGSTTLFMQS